jgi:alkaline phosphatase D
LATPRTRPVNFLDMHALAIRQVVRAAGPALARAALALAVCAATLPAAGGLVVMHGYAELTSATLWIQTDRAAAVSVRWRVDGESDERAMELMATDANDHVVVAHLAGLKPSGTAAYRVAAGPDHREGVLRAQPYWAKPRDASELTVAIGSCFFLADANPAFPGNDYGGGFGIFDAIAAKRPDLMLWLGDNLYLQQPDLFDPQSMAMRYRRQRQFESLQGLLTATTHLAIWDDHDFGPNDSDASNVFKGEALTLFQRYWPNPSFGLPDVPGTFGVARYGDVLFFLLDDRYYRYPDRWPDGADKTMFGARQLEWLKQALVSAPRNAIKIVAGGSQFWSRANRFEGWFQFGSERRAFAEWLVERKIDGVIFLSGDRHFSELLKIERPGAYPLYEFTSSPLTSRPPARIDAADRDNPDVVPGTLVVKRQFGLIRVSGPGDDRRLALESYDGAGELLWRHEVRARDLRHPGTRRPPE